MCSKRKIRFDELKKKTVARKNGFCGRLFVVRECEEHLFKRYPNVKLDSELKGILELLENWAVKKDQGDNLVYTERCGT